MCVSEVLSQGSGVLDIAGGRGDVSFELQTVRGIRSAPTSFSSTHGHQACLPSMSTKHVYQACLPSMSAKHVYQACLASLSVEHVHRACVDSIASSVVVVWQLWQDMLYPHLFLSLYILIPSHTLCIRPVTDVSSAVK